MVKCKDLGDYNKDQNVMLDWIRTSPKQQVFMGCSWYAVISTYIKWSKEEQLVNCNRVMWSEG